MAVVLSIVVPVYNVRDYLNRCIDSLLNQDISKNDYEIILIDDGSTDTSGSICDEYASRVDIIKVIHQPNQGLSAARNKGVSLAKGDFIQFVDSDDFIEGNVLAGMLSRIQNDKLDIMRFNYENVDEADRIIHPNKNPKLFADYSSTITDGNDFILSRLGFACYACQFIVRRELMIRYPFTVGIHFEDTEWVTRILPAANRVSSTNQVVYFYRIREGSITKATQIDRIRKNVEDQIGLIKLFKARGSGMVHPSWYDSMISITVLSIVGIVAKELYSEKQQILSTLKRQSVFPLTTYKQTKQASRKIRLINVSPSLYCFLIQHLR